MNIIDTKQALADINQRVERAEYIRKYGYPIFVPHENAFDFTDILIHNNIRYAVRSETKYGLWLNLYLK